MGRRRTFSARASEAGKRGSAAEGLAAAFGGEAGAEAATAAAVGGAAKVRSFFRSIQPKTAAITTMTVTTAISTLLFGVVVGAGDGDGNEAVGGREAAGAMGLTIGSGVSFGGAGERTGLEDGPIRRLGTVLVPSGGEDDAEAAGGTSLPLLLARAAAM